MKVDVEVIVNGGARSAAVEPRRLLVDFLRDDLELTGTHVGCEHGVCGSCTVLVDGEQARSCLVFAVQCDGRSITTIEGISVGAQLPMLQQAMRETHAFQCGFCTPGFLIAITRLLEEIAEPNEQDIRAYLSGNLCRCTGYESIVNGVLLTCERRRAAQFEIGSAQ